MRPQPPDQSARRKLGTVEAPWVTGVAGLTIIVSAFLISVVNALIETPTRSFP